jgi:MerR family transcriptional regulator, light-induced transcriptional regulator
MNVFTIKDLENLSGIKAHTIRIWEQRYHFLKPERTSTNIRYYSNDELKKILNIALLNKYGFKISHIDKMNGAEIEEKINTLTQVEAKQERLINLLIQQMVDLDVDAFNNTLSIHIQQKGIEKTVTQIIFPFLEKIGLFWLTGHVNPAQEHLVSNIIRQKIILGIETIHPAISTGTSAVLFLPDGEHHELALLFMHYMLKSRGVKVYYIGASIPIKHVETVVIAKKPSFVFTHLTSVAGSFNVDKFFAASTHAFRQSKFILSGQLLKSYKKELPAGVIIKNSLPEVLDYMLSVSHA